MRLDFVYCLHFHNNRPTKICDRSVSCRVSYDRVIGAQLGSSWFRDQITIDHLRLADPWHPHKPTPIHRPDLPDAAANSCGITFLGIWYQVLVPVPRFGYSTEMRAPELREASFLHACAL
jgi:hypothetical protein